MPLCVTMAFLPFTLCSISDATYGGLLRLTSAFLKYHNWLLHAILVLLMNFMIVLAIHYNMNVNANKHYESRRWPETK